MASILIVDESAEIRKIIRAFLETEAASHLCDEAVDGFDAVEKAEILKPDLIIVDYYMPRMNGLDTARALRATKNEVPIILFTFYADVFAPTDLSAAGITAVYSKSDFSGLLQHIRRVLN